MKTFHDFGIEVTSNTGQVSTTCPECSNQRRKKNVKCLSVNTDEGVWCCHHCGWTGTLKVGSQRTNNLHWRKPQYRKRLTQREFYMDSTTSRRMTRP